MNNVTMVGRLCRDPEVRYTSGNTPTEISNFSIAVDRRFKRDGQDNADFFDVTAFGKTAEFVDKYFTKGMRIGITGRLQNNNYKNRDGVMIYRNVIIAENVEFVESKKTETEPKHEEKKEDPDNFMQLPDGISEELPFT